MSTKKVYIAGPMSGYPEFNFPKFFATEAMLKEQGWTVFNPANKAGEDAISDDAAEVGDTSKAIGEGLDMRKAYLWDVTKIINGDAIYMLPGWENSPGARGEHAVAVAMQKYYSDYQIMYEGSLSVEHRAAA